MRDPTTVLGLESMAIIEPDFLKYSEKISLLNLENHLQAWGRATV
jgi:hypothetical protein